MGSSARLGVAISLFCIISLCSDMVCAAPRRYSLSGKVIDGAGYTVLLVQKSGSTRSSVIGSSGKFVFRRINAAALRNASLQLADTEGQYAGPVVLAGRRTRVFTTFSGKARSGTVIALGAIAIQDGYARVRRAPPALIYKAPRIAAVDGKPIGAGEFGLVATAGSSQILVRANEEITPGQDLDGDGLPNGFDADDDGDLVVDASDPDSLGQDVPYTSLGFDFRTTLNAHVRTGLSDSLIDAAIGGENLFNLTFFFSLPQESSIDGGYVRCSDSLVYCRRNTPLGYYGGISESSSEFRDRPWSELLNDDGYPRMEQVTIGGGSDKAIVASIQPRVGRSQFRVGDVYEVVLTEGGAESSRRSLALTPYAVSVPAIKEYNAGSGTVTVAYDSVSAESGSIPGVSQSDPIILSSEGTLTVSFWRMQRQALRSDESGYIDWGNLHYGVIIENAQATCGGYYTGLSSELTEASSYLGTDNSPLANQGANIYPLTDSQGDRATSSAYLLTLTVDLKSCLARAGGTAGTYVVNLTAAGEEVTGGQITANQRFYVQIP